jgi:hypothetical protein
MTNNESDSGLRPSRRTVVKGAAWAVPAVAVAASTPASAASPEPPEIDFGQSQLCKLPGNSAAEKCFNKGYVAFLVFDNTENTEDYTVCSVDAIFKGDDDLCIVGISDAETACGTFADEIVIPGGEELTIAVWTNGNDESAGGMFSVTFTGSFDGCATPEQDTQTGNLVGAAWPDNGVGSCTARPGNCTDIPSICGSGLCGATG